MHADAKVESIGQTAAHLLTYCGLGLSERGIDDIDWVEWVKLKLFKRYRITYFGMVSHRNLRSVGSESWVEVRRCPHCGTDRRTYEGVVIHVVRSPHIRIITISERSRNI